MHELLKLDSGKAAITFLLDWVTFFLFSKSLNC